MALPDFPDYNKWGFSLVALNNDVYVTGRCQGCWVWGGGHQGVGMEDGRQRCGHGALAWGQGLPSSLSRALSLLPSWVDPATGEGCPKMAMLRGGGPPDLSLPRWLSGVPE